MNRRQQNIAAAPFVGSRPQRKFGCNPRPGVWRAIIIIIDKSASMLDPGQIESIVWLGLLLLGAAMTTAMLAPRVAPAMTTAIASFFPR